MNNCIPCPPCEDNAPLVCDPYETVSVGNRLMVEDDAFCTKTLENPNSKGTLVWDNGIKWSFSTGWKSVISSYFAENNDKLSVNSSSGPLQIILPQSPAQFAEIILADHFSSWGTNNVTVIPNGQFIENSASSLILDTTWPTQITLRYEGTTWRVYSIL